MLKVGVVSLRLVKASIATTQHCKYQLRKLLGLSRVTQQLHHLILMGIATAQNRIIHGFRKVAEHRLFWGVIRQLVHD